MMTRLETSYEKSIWYEAVTAQIKELERERDAIKALPDKNLIKRIVELEARVAQWHLDALKYSGMYTESVATIKELEAEYVNKLMDKNDTIKELESLCERFVNAYPDWRDEYEALGGKE
jgi:hypothetical protein